MTDGYTVGCLTPRTNPWQYVHSVDVHAEPAASGTDRYIDAWGNTITQFGMHTPHDTVEFVAISEVDLWPRIYPSDDTPWEQVVQQLDDAHGDLVLETGFFRSSSQLINLDELRGDLGAILDAVFVPGRTIVEVADALNQHIFDEFEFDATFSNVSTPLSDVVAQRRGVCQDFAHLAVGCMRAVGLAARYVSGYIETLPPPGQPRLVGADASHAWCEVWTPQAGWIDFDPTNGHLPVNDHITVGWGRDYADVTPVRGIVIGPHAEQSLTVSVDVARQ